MLAVQLSICMQVAEADNETVNRFGCSMVTEPVLVQFLLSLTVKL